MANYDDVKFSSLSGSPDDTRMVRVNVLDSAPGSRVTSLRNREVSHSTANCQYQLIGHGSRGIVCLVSDNSKLTVIDAEDNEGDEDEDMIDESDTNGDAL